MKLWEFFFLEELDVEVRSYAILYYPVKNETFDLLISADCIISKREMK